MAYRPAQIYTGSGWDDIGDPRVGTVQTDVTNLQNGKLAYETPLTDQSGTTYTFALADARRITRATNAAAKTFTIPPQTSVTWANNTIIRVFNAGAGALTVNGGSGVTVTNTAKTIGQYEAAAAIRTGSNAWTLVPFSGGLENADFSNTATGTFSKNGKNYKYMLFTGNSTLNISKAGKGIITVIGGGGGGGRQSFGGGGGAGALLLEREVFIQNTGAFPVRIGAGGVNGGSTGTGTYGGNSSLLGFMAHGGSPGRGEAQNGFAGILGASASGASGKGCCGSTSAFTGGAGDNLPPFAAGGSGGNVVAGANIAPGGGGGAGGNGSNNRVAGAGVVVNVTGSNITVCRGGGDGTVGTYGGGGNTFTNGQAGAVVFAVEV
jgi:hypothetical protein